MSKVAEAEAPKLSGLKYLVESILHADDEGTVMLVGDRNRIGKRYVLKVVKREKPEDDARLDAARASAEASAKLGHPAILHYHDFRLRRSWFRVARGELLMEYVPGASLDRLEGVGVGPWVLIFRQVATALSHMHRRGVRYGDLKPSHVLLSRAGQVKALGYGLGAAAKREKPRGTRLYMAPEQFRGDVISERSDLYNLGATMYHMLTGQPANVGKRGEGESGKIPLPTALNHKIPSALNNLIVACLQSDPPKRPESAYDVQKGLDQIAHTLKLDDSSLKGLAAEPEAPE